MWYDIKEFEANQKKEVEDGSYGDDGSVSVTCLYCGTETCVLSTPCCETRRKKDDEGAKRTMESISHLFGDY